MITTFGEWLDKKGLNENMLTRALGMKGRTPAAGPATTQQTEKVPPPQSKFQAPMEQAKGVLTFLGIDISHLDRYVQLAMKNPTEFNRLKGFNCFGDFHTLAKFVQDDRPFEEKLAELKGFKAQQAGDWSRGDSAR